VTFFGLCKGNKYVDRIEYRGRKQGTTAVKHTRKPATGYTNGSSCRPRKRCWSLLQWVCSNRCMQCT